MPGMWGDLYNTPRWRKMRASHLHLHPCCEMCLSQGFDVRGTIVDHIRPHRGDPRLFFNPDNLQSLCKPHHDSTKQRTEKRGLMCGCDADGNPLDPRHPWNRQTATRR